MNKRSKQMLIRVLVTAAIPLTGLIIVWSTMMPEGMTDGEELYAKHCSNCHGKEGEGLRSLYPPLAGSDYLRDHQADLPCMLIHGMEGPIAVNGKIYDLPMPGVETLNGSQVYRIMEYINTSWGNDIETAPKEKVKAVVKRCPSHN